MANPLIQHAITMAYHPTHSSKLQSTQSFYKLATSSSHSQIVKLCRSTEALNALKHLAQQDESAEIAAEAMKTWLQLCKLRQRDLIQHLVMSFHILSFLSKQLMYFDENCKLLAAQCVGELSRYDFSCRRLVSEKVLQPLCALIRPKQNWNVLQAACFALSRIHTTSEMMNRVIIVWGLTPLKEMVDRLLKHTKKLELRRHQMSTTEKRIQDTQRNPSFELLEATCEVWSNFSLYSQLACKMQEEGILQQLQVLLKFSLHMPVRREAAKAILNLTEHKTLRNAIMDDEPMLLTLFSCSSDANFDVKHSIASALDNLLAHCPAKQQDYLHSLIIKEANIQFIDWILKTANCNHILSVVLEVLTSSNEFICSDNRDAFGSEVFKMLMGRLKNSADPKVKQMCAETLYCFAKVPCFRDEIIRAQAAEMLIFMLSSKEEMFRQFATKTLAELCDSTQRTGRFIDLGICSVAIRQYVLSMRFIRKNHSISSLEQILSPSEMEHCLNFTKILHALSDFNDFRNNFASHPKALNILLYLFDHTKDVDFLNYSLKIMLKLTLSANKEGAGNGNLRVLSEKRLYRILSLLDPGNGLLPDSKNQQLILDLIKSFAPHHNIPMDNNGNASRDSKKNFWDIALHEILTWVAPRGSEDRLAFEDHRAHLMKFVFFILKKHPHVIQDTNWDYLLHAMMNVLVKTPKLSRARLWCVKSLQLLKMHDSEKLLQFLEGNFEYCESLNLDINSNNEIGPKFFHFLTDYIAHFDERQAIAQQRSKRSLGMLRSSMLRDPGTFAEKIRDNYSEIRKGQAEEDERRIQERLKKRKAQKERKEREKNKFSLLREWKSQVEDNSSSAVQMPELLDIQTPKVNLRVKNLKGDMDPKLERKMRRRIDAFERMQQKGKTPRGRSS